MLKTFVTVLWRGRQRTPGAARRRVRCSPRVSRLVAPSGASPRFGCHRGHPPASATKPPCGPGRENCGPCQPAEQSHAHAAETLESALPFSSYSHAVYPTGWFSQNWPSITDVEPSASSLKYAFGPEPLPQVPVTAHPAPWYSVSTHTPWSSLAVPQSEESVIERNDAHAQPCP